MIEKLYPNLFLNLGPNNERLKHSNFLNLKYARDVRQLSYYKIDQSQQQADIFSMLII